MNFSVRLFLGYFLLVGLTGWFYLRSFVAELTPGMRQSIEEVLVDMAHLLAEQVAAELAAGRIGDGEFAAGIERFKQRRFQAAIRQLNKQEPNLVVYITDAAGRVVFDSRGRDLGQDYSRWNDVYLTLRGQYGARSTREDTKDPLSSVMYVGAPILDPAGHLLGVISLGKPSLSVMPFVEAAKRNLQEKGLWLLLASLTLGVLFTLWLTSSIRRLTRYARAVRDGRQVSRPRVSERELATLAEAMESMRAELEGKAYVERYLHSLTHELKSPLTAIQGAAELLDEAMPPATRRRFLANIRNESGRLRQIVERLLGLAALENRQGLEQVETLDTAELAQTLLESKQPQAAAKGIRFETRLDQELQIRGERFLVLQAISNLLDNAIDFSPADGLIRIESRREGDGWYLAIQDQGPGIPDYAQERLFERFFSTPRPESGRKSSGLGLSLVREVARLHGGEIRVDKAPEGGARAALRLPLGGR